jgi:hypothetical protein
MKTSANQSGTNNGLEAGAAIPEPSSRSNGMLYLAMAVTLTASIILFTFVFTEPLLSKDGPLSSATINVYTFFITVVGTLITGSIISQISAVWVRDVDERAERSQTETQLQGLDERWRVAMQIAHLGERFRYPKIWASFLTAALITSCFTAGMSPNTVIDVIPYQAMVPNGAEYVCAETVHDSGLANATVAWQTKPGEWFIIQDWTGCPIVGASALTALINTFDPLAFAYADMGVAVRASAIGAPAAVYGWQPGRDNAIRYLSYGHRNSLQATFQCVAVMVRNPVSCRLGGKVQISGTNMSVTSDDRTCTASDSFLSSGLDPHTDHAMVKGMCSGVSVGEATIVFGASNEYASQLAATVNNLNGIHDNTPGRTLAVTCTVNVSADVYQFQVVMLGFRNRGGNSDDPLGKFLVGLGPCATQDLPAEADSIIGNPLRGLAAAANIDSLGQAYGLDGYFYAIAATALNVSTPSETYTRTPPWAFNNSQNALEDVLGLTAALVGSRMYAGQVNMVTLPGFAQILIVRVGSGSKVALLYVVPPLVVLVFLASKREALRNQRTRWKTGHLKDLVAYGKALAGGYRTASPEA